MINNKRIAVVFPAYNAEQTLVRTYNEVVAQGVVDHIILVDDQSRDGTATLARSLPGVTTLVHPKNRGYGGNQKTCYRAALELGADVVVMVHPDYQYTPKLVMAMAAPIAFDVYPCMLGSRILGGLALRAGMPWWRYFSNRALTLFANLAIGAKLSEYHTGYRAFSRELLQRCPVDRFSDDFIFDNEMLVWILGQGMIIGEVTCPTKYFAEASSISFARSVKYGLGCLQVALSHRLRASAVTHAVKSLPVDAAPRQTAPNPA